MLLWANDNIVANNAEFSPNTGSLSLPSRRDEGSSERKESTVWVVSEK